MSNMSIEEALASGDPELIDKALSAMDSPPGDDDPAVVKTEQKQEPIQPPPAEKLEDVKEVSASSDADKPVVETAAILSKDGNHVIPYKVLEGTRTQVKELSEKLALAQEELTKFKQPPTNNSAIEELKEVSPEIADAFASMQQRVADAEARAGNALTPDQIEALVAKAATPDLVRWEKSDPERYALAVQIDNALINHPDYQDKTTADRFADVVKMVKGEYGELVTEKPKVDPIAEKAAAIVAKHAQEATGLPKTLTDVGAQHSSVQRSKAEVWAEKSADQIAKDMENMTPEQINQILANLV